MRLIHKLKVNLALWCCVQSYGGRTTKIVKLCTLSLLAPITFSPCLRTTACVLIHTDVHTHAYGGIVFAERILGEC